MLGAWKFLTSAKLAVFLGGSILAAGLAGTLLGGGVAATRVYRAPWFLLLLGAFGVNLLACSIQRARFLRPPTAGSFVSHVGALLILAGAAIGGLWGAAGNSPLPMPEETPLDRIASDDGKSEHVLPFQIVIEKFSLDLYPPRLWVLDRGQEESHVVRPGLSVRSGEFELTAEAVTEGPVVRLRIRGRGKDRIATLLLGDRWTAEDADFSIVYDYRAGYAGDIRSFDSRIRIVENGQVVKTETVSVNRPLVHKGYRIYQNAHLDASGPRWRPALRIVRDPGIPVVYVGFGVLGIGLLYASFVRPLLRRRTP
ncbi:MAG: cytochrome c biogenesis protein ResB [Planctomycetes bacterium]|nr:cytochrome c biogenesis protein ResB [Planctomycetota bacterium]